MVPKDPYCESNSQNQQYWLISLQESEVKAIFTNAPPAPCGSVAVSSQIRSAYRKAAGLADDAEGESSTVSEEVTIEVEKEVKGKRNVIGEDCPV